MDGLRIVRARVRGSAFAPDLQARLARRVDAAMRGLDPGEAILCLREAGGVLGEGVLSAPLDRAHADWRPIVEQTRARLAAARRPWAETVTPDALAVRFADTAEWLACAALDLLAHRIESCWWWCSLPQPGAAGVLAAWLQHPQAVPGAMALLAQRRAAVAFVQRCATQAAILRQHLKQCFGLSDTPGPAGADASCVIADALADCDTADARSLGEAPRAWLWLALGLQRLPSAMAAAPLPPASWIADAATVAPAEARSALRDAQSQALPAVDQGDVGRAAVQAHVGRAEPLRPIRVMHGVGRVAPAILLAANDAQAPTPAADAQSALPTPIEERPLGREQARPAAGGPYPPAVAPALPPPLDWSEPAPLPLEPPARLPSAGEPRTAAPRDLHAGQALVSDCGGVFHLLNLALALDLYPDFSRPAERGLALHPWDFLALLATAMLGEAFAADPLADWLADAAGRPRDCVPGLWAGAPPPDWRLPPGWLVPWAAQRASWRSAQTKRRHALWHPAGFCVADLPRDSALRGEDWPGWRAPRHTPLRGRRLPRAITSWPEWIARLVPFVRARLGAATGFPPDTAAEQVLCRPARIRRIGETVEVHMSLAALPIEVRLAGLDRDLGWLPAAGCALRYRFDSGAS
ncbi:hypothetical protein GCM10025771_11950 [Niveibacterium umoris]|uniref:Uncharacterized protein n=1 Tax=Niveibacterium umoris TaxID=1193620 RepID=A0A840BJV7_9RHOO|nr:hypothetical protein [Niveibacterium umoris]MBB4013250.1 hypothetical protein [Niveibacterium umoris]